ncbi:MAG TPA: outer membrane beta-barrel protein [Candidatus Nanopelagicales bacterium]|nr:outer membrane beta-barrel protein [Candidatus Nanopelagicales bacterium]
MKTRGLVAVGLTALATVTFAGIAGAQEQPGPAMNVPPADEPLIERIPEPSYSVEGGFGILGYVGDAAAVGPAWNVRLTARINPRFAGELSYTGAASEANRVNETLVMTGIDASVRYNILRADEAIVQPFVAAGVGYAGWAGAGGDPFALTVPVSAGVERMLTPNVKIGARLNVKPAFFDEIGTAPRDGDAPGGDTWSLVGNVGGAF